MAVLVLLYKLFNGKQFKWKSGRSKSHKRLKTEQGCKGENYNQAIRFESDLQEIKPLYEIID